MNNLICNTLSRLELGIKSYISLKIADVGYAMMPMGTNERLFDNSEKLENTIVSTINIFNSPSTFDPQYIAPTVLMTLGGIGTTLYLGLYIKNYIDTGRK